MFQSSPGPKAECYARPDCRAVWGLPVSILTRPEGRVLQAWAWATDGPGRVSILTRPEGRVLHPRRLRDNMRGNRFQSSPGPKAECYGGGDWPLVIASQFQSSPGPKAECYDCPAQSACITTNSFNPHPARRPSATTRRKTSSRTHPRRFNPHPARRPSATQLQFRHKLPIEGVSILTRPEGRVLPLGMNDQTRGLDVFQSSPGPKAECYNKAQDEFPYTSKAFQSSPGPKAECYDPGLAELALAHAVSILTRPEGRVLQKRWLGRRCTSRCFNPHPARRPSATSYRIVVSYGATVSILTRPEGRVLLYHTRLARRISLFQSSPGPKAECYSSVVRSRAGMPFRFQSSPGPKAERYDHRGDRAGLADHVSILTRPEGRVLQYVRAGVRPLDLVSRHCQVKPFERRRR